MSEATETQPIDRVHWSFWVISALTLLWHIGGVANFIIQMMDADMIEGYRESERAIIEGRPIWATGAFAIAVFGGALGSLLLLLKKASAFYLFCLSLFGVISTMVYALSTGIDFSAAEIIGIIAMPVVLPAFLVFYSKRTERRGWLT